MALTSTTNKITQNCNGALTAFDFTFPITEASDLQVIMTLISTGVEQVLALTTNYAVVASSNDFANGGTVTTVATWSALYTITIYRNVPITQPSTFTENMQTLYQTFEDGLNRLTMIDQAQEERIDSALKTKKSDSDATLELPIATDRASRYLAFDASGEPIASSGSPDSVVPVSAFMETLLDDANAAAVRATIGSSYSTSAEIIAGTEAAKAIAPDALKAVRAVDAAFWGIKNLRLIQAKVGDATRVQVNPDNMNIALNIGDHYHVMTAAVDVDEVDNLDTGTLAAGTNYYVYACTDGTTLSFLVSANSTNPTGFDAAHSRKIGGFHTLCVAVGTIGGHTLTGYAQKDILPASVWCLKHRAKSLVNVGMVYDSGIQKWVDIYLASGTGTGTTSVNGGTISDTRDWNDFVDDGYAVGKRLLSDFEFQRVAVGSNEETNITGSADPGTTGGHVDTAGRRMISNIGCEDCCGVVWQWLQDQSSMYSTAAAGWYDLPGSKGQLYRPANSNDVKLLAGGGWDYAANCGSRSRLAHNYRWNTNTNIGARFVSEPL